MSLSFPLLCNSLKYLQQLEYPHPHSAIFFQAVTFIKTCNIPASRGSFLHLFLPNFFCLGVGIRLNSFLNCFSGNSLLTSYTGSHLLLRLLPILIVFRPNYQTLLSFETGLKSATKLFCCQAIIK